MRDVAGDHAVVDRDVVEAVHLVAVTARAQVQDRPQREHEQRPYRQRDQQFLLEARPLGKGPMESRTIEVLVDWLAVHHGAMAPHVLVAHFSIALGIGVTARCA